MKESARKCSYCGNNGHNSRTCHDNIGGGGGGKCFKLFGVNIVISEHQSLQKSVSISNLESHDFAEEHRYNAHESGYLSDGVVHRRKPSDTNKGKAWNEEEHKNFLIGLEKLGKGGWRGISKRYVPTRTATQVASHAQKYFLRQTATDHKKKRRTSLFDMPLTKQHALAPQDYSSVGSSSKVPETSSQKCVKIASPSQAMTPSQVADRFPGFCLDPHLMAPPNVVPSFHGIPYMAGGGVPRVSLLPVNVMKYDPRKEYIYMPSGIPSDPHESFQPLPTPEKDSPDQPPKNVSTLASGSISVT